MSSGKYYAVCVRNEGFEESLEVRKIYELLSNEVAEGRGFVRVVDEDDTFTRLPGSCGSTYPTRLRPRSRERNDEHLGSFSIESLTVPGRRHRPFQTGA